MASFIWASLGSDPPPQPVRPKVKTADKGAAKANAEAKASDPAGKPDGAAPADGVAPVADKAAAPEDPTKAGGPEGSIAPDGVKLERPRIASVAIEDHTANQAGRRRDSRRQKNIHAAQFRIGLAAIVVAHHRVRAAVGPAIGDALERRGYVGQRQSFRIRSEGQVRADEVEARAEHKHQAGVQVVHEQPAEPAAAERAAGQQADSIRRFAGSDSDTGQMLDPVRDEQEIREGGRDSLSSTRTRYPKNALFSVAPTHTARPLSSFPAIPSASTRRVPTFAYVNSVLQPGSQNEAS